jgi:hypothetical protein
MSLRRNNKPFRKKRPAKIQGKPAIFVVETTVSGATTLFPEKLKKINEMLSRAIFMQEEPRASC